MASVWTHKTNCLFQMSLFWSPGCTEKWVNTICHLSHCIKGVGKQCRLNWPASTVYPRGPKFTEEHYLFCTHVPNTRHTVTLPCKYRCAFKHGHWDIQHWDFLYLCMHAKRTRDKTRRHTWTCIKLDMHVHKNLWFLTSEDKAHKGIEARMHKYYTHSVFVSVWTCRFTVFGKQLLAFIWLWNRDILPLLDTFHKTELFSCLIRYFCGKCFRRFKD